MGEGSREEQNREEQGREEQKREAQSREEQSREEQNRGWSGKLGAIADQFQVLDVTLAQILHCSEMHVRQIRKGKSAPSESEIRKILRTFPVREEWLLEGTGGKAEDPQSADPQSANSQAADSRAATSQAADSKAEDSQTTEGQEAAPQDTVNLVAATGEAVSQRTAAQGAAGMEPVLQPVESNASLSMLEDTYDGLTASQRLRQLRLSFHLSVPEFAEQAGLPEEQIEKLENGQIHFRMNTARQIADACRVGVEWLLYGKVERKENPVTGEMKAWLWLHPQVRERICRAMEAEVSDKCKDSSE